MLRHCAQTNTDFIGTGTENGGADGVIQYRHRKTGPGNSEEAAKQ